MKSGDEAVSLKFSMATAVAQREHYENDEWKVFADPADSYTKRFRFVSFRLRVGIDAMPLRVLVPADGIVSDEDLIRKAKERLHVILRAGVQAADWADKKS